MKRNVVRNRLGVLLFALSAGISAHASPDEEAARALMKRNDCLKCHAINRAKTGPALQAVAAKYRGDPAAVDKVIKHITTGPAINMPDGSVENHRIIDTKNEQELRNLVAWILAQ